MLSSMVKNYRTKQQQMKTVQAKRQQDVVNAAYKFNEGIMTEINSQVSIAYTSQVQLDTEMKILQSQANRFSKLSSQWSTTLNGFNTALKELGDVQNWAESIEQDLQSVAKSLEYLNQKNKQNQAQVPK